MSDDYTPSDELARALDPEAFEDHGRDPKRGVGVLAWSARQKWATDEAKRLLASRWLAEHDARVLGDIADQMDAEQQYEHADWLRQRAAEYRKAGQ